MSMLKRMHMPAAGPGPDGLGDPAGTGKGPRQRYLTYCKKRGMPDNGRFAAIVRHTWNLVFYCS